MAQNPNGSSNLSVVERLILAALNTLGTGWKTAIGLTLCLAGTLAGLYDPHLSLPILGSDAPARVWDAGLIVLAAGGFHKYLADRGEKPKGHSS